MGIFLYDDLTVILMICLSHYLSSAVHFIMVQNILFNFEITNQHYISSINSYKSAFHLFFSESFSSFNFYIALIILC